MAAQECWHQATIVPDELGCHKGGSGRSVGGLVGVLGWGEGGARMWLDSGPLSSNLGHAAILDS